MFSFHLSRTIAFLSLLCSAWYSFWAQNPFVKGLKFYSCLLKRIGFNESFSSVRSTTILCVRNKPYSSINSQWKVCDQKTDRSCQSYSACICFTNKLQELVKKHVRILCAAEAIYTCFPSAFQEPF